MKISSHCPGISSEFRSIWRLPWLPCLDCFPLLPALNKSSTCLVMITFGIRPSYQNLTGMFLMNMGQLASTSPIHFHLQVTGWTQTNPVPSLDLCKIFNPIHERIFQQVPKSPNFQNPHMVFLSICFTFSPWPTSRPSPAPSGAPWTRRWAPTPKPWTPGTGSGRWRRSGPPNGPQLGWLGWDKMVDWMEPKMVDWLMFEG